MDSGYLTVASSFPLRDKDTDYSMTFDDAVCSIGMILLSFDFIIYTASLFYVIKVAWTTLDWSKVGWMSLLILIFPVFYFLSEAFIRFWVYKVEYPKDVSTGFIYYNDSKLGYVVHIAGILNYTLINVFLLRVFKVAAILKCESK